MQSRFIESIHEIDAKDWNRLCGLDYPFLRHEFFVALEDSGSTTEKTGWKPYHLILIEEDRLVAVMPLFQKTHSYGEYVFDWGWADAWHRHGQQYYPKLVNAIPFTPSTGPRWGIAGGYDSAAVLKHIVKAIKSEIELQEWSSCHWLFTETEDTEALLDQQLLKRTGCQYHWYNQGFTCFEDFIQRFNSRKRKNLLKERRKVTEQQISVVVREGTEITKEQWRQFYQFYQMTYFKRSGHQGYLNRQFFELVGDLLADQVAMAQAFSGEKMIAGALYFKSNDTLFGRYWGCIEEHEFLHFELCYYQGIEYAISSGLQHFDAGAQGEHKLQRGFEPTPTYSCHWIADPSFKQAVANFLDEETDYQREYIESAREQLPFKKEES